MAASKPTSWLSLLIHFLSHSKFAWRPYKKIWAVSLLAKHLGMLSLSASHQKNEGIRSFHGIGKALGHPNPASALHPSFFDSRSTYIDFAKNQLSTSLVGLSPLPPNLLSILQHTRVRSSKEVKLLFNLFRSRSLVFGSHTKDWH
jgi:hypothetical protein